MFLMAHSHTTQKQIQMEGTPAIKVIVSVCCNFKFTTHILHMLYCFKGQMLFFCIFTLNNQFSVLGNGS